ncbi:hypothetical protein ONZ51_g11399 [Trametes cubensis]|uniref:Heterokaryon incompatibility domain-containing protein n=1 Tax=Trametes cubensis TaxID=1111947 RepID=A0AAD7X447_9APHY|nr:hypothetical protein ONZ51_g11399 [Trametes cubensis]
MSAQRRLTTSNDIELPPRPANVCARCWEGVFAAHFGLWSDPVEKRTGSTGSPQWAGGYEYSITEAEWTACRNSLCCWGKFIQKDVFELYERLRGFEQFKQLGNFGPPWHFRMGTPSGLKPEKATQSMLTIVVNDYPDIVLGVFAHMGIDDPAAACIEGRTRNPFVARPDMLNMARSLVKDCVQNHEHCRVSSDSIGSAALPTRLIDCCNPSYPRVVETKDWRSHVPYVALSYVWGNEGQLHRLTSENLSKYLVGIDPLLLPPTITDAIHVTHTVLRVRFLWIDKLPGIDYNINPWHSNLSHSIEYVRTGKRAWCLQEALMSRRRLLFTELDLQFRCRSATTRHVGGPENPHPESWDVTPPQVVFERSALPVLPDSDHWNSIHRAWQKLVVDYMRRSLSYTSDRLVACAGLAEVFGLALRSDYLAGLWKDSLVYDLLWYTSLGEGNGQHGDDRAPSWSWAASAGVGPITYEHLHFQTALGTEPYVQLAEVGECAVTLENLELRFGPVTSGFITLRAHLLGPFKKRTDFGAAGYPTAVCLDPMADHRDGEHQLFVPWMDRAYKPEEELFNVWLVPLIYHRSHLGDSERDMVYRRVGYYSRAEDTAGKESDDFVDWLQGFPRTDIRLALSALSISSSIGRAPLPSRLADCFGVQGTYVALSYVWGEDQSHRTTEGNLHTYIDGIHPEQLPQTTGDAIFVIHVLGYRFLWVDSLCIVQDSLDDKHQELRTMRNVYRRAVLTTNATTGSASKVSDGFLQVRQPFHRAEALPFISPCSIQGRNGSSLRVGTIYLARIRICARARDSVVTAHNPCGCQWETRLDTGQTGCRAWCLQESLMSCRSLVFTANTIHLRCQTATQTVGGTYHATALDPTRLPDLLLSPDPRRARVSYSSQDLTQVHQAWRMIVQDYTRRALSEPSDKLIACAGLAEEFARVLRSEYLAGLWSDSLFEDLLWVRSSLSPSPVVSCAVVDLGFSGRRDGMVQR